MIPWKLIDRAQVPGHGGEMCLYQRGGEFTIRLAAGELMNSRALVQRTLWPNSRVPGFPTVPVRGC
jgi:hypothetical protein